jgi:hypothetical protein
VLDQEVAASRRISKQGEHFLARTRFDAPPFGCRTDPAAAAALFFRRGRGHVRRRRGCSFHFFVAFRLPACAFSQPTSMLSFAAIFAIGREKPL